MRCNCAEEKVAETRGRSGMIKIEVFNLLDTLTIDEMWRRIYK